MGDDERVIPFGDTMTVVTVLSNQILRDMKILASEESHPSSDADSSDAKIVDTRKRIKGLREIRQHYEDLMTGTSVT